VTATDTKGMNWVVGGTFHMGSAAFYPEEAPVHPVELDGFWVDRHPVTVREFRAFVEATGYVTVAERPLDPAAYPDADPELLVSGSLVFQKAPQRVRLADYRQWWAYVPGASWRHPGGPGTDLRGRHRHPVTHVTHEDAATFAEWAGKALPTEAEWEYMARGGLEGAVFAWGDEEKPGGKLMANTWQGEFPWRNHKAAGYEGTSPVGAFPPNGYGLYDVTGNVWEWTDDYFTPKHAGHADTACCVPRNRRAELCGGIYVAGKPGPQIPRRVIKGGSHLCAPNYCLRYRPAARQGEAIDTSTSHLGFRCVLRPPETQHQVIARAS
jgi:formylglycine-generating enzyme